MAKKRKQIQTKVTPKQKGKIAEKQQFDDEIIFSFKYLDLHGNPKFSIAGCGESYLAKLLLRLKDLSRITYNEFVSSQSSALRSHKIYWPKTTEPNGFTCLNAELREQQAFQFEISANEHGRVHGFLVNNIFYIVWLDPHHNLYS